MRRRGCLLGIAGVLGLCLLACVVGVVFGLPAFRDNVREDVADGIATEIARQIPALPGDAPPPGDYTVTAASLQQHLRAESDAANVEDIVVRITPTALEFGFASQGQEILYAGTPRAENGRFVLPDLDANNDVLEFFLPPGDLARAVEDGVNRYLELHDLRLDALELGDGEMTLTTAPAR